MNRFVYIRLNHVLKTYLSLLFLKNHILSIIYIIMTSDFTRFFENTSKQNINLKDLTPIIFHTEASISLLRFMVSNSCRKHCYFININMEVFSLWGNCIIPKLYGSYATFSCIQSCMKSSERK